MPHQFADRHHVLTPPDPHQQMRLLSPLRPDPSVDELVMRDHHI